ILRDTEPTLLVECVCKQVNAWTCDSVVTLSLGGSQAKASQETNHRTAKQKKEIKLMKNCRLTIFATILSVLACFGLLSGAQAQEGDLGGGNTNEGFHALNSLNGGGFNTGLGWYSLGSLTDAFYDTGVGAGALVLADEGTNTAVAT